ncbi:glycosyltransferase family protein [Polynucleobacter alcilacus]|uniref:glycosyltransferase family protein n=1 Tax=Polynucleobacter alcilacus TaxID=1819739 RepID=UPI001C0D760D|nr:glycosyltransferase [Polynucleobacter alcilacus]MBU3568184.1 glycosyltransferase family 1 protein [Polynucleobacter alcilacus]
MRLLRKFYFDWVLPKTIFVPYFILKVILWPTYILSLLKKYFRKRSVLNSIVCIEAGEKGWESIEFKEMYQSAVEYFGVDNVIKLVIHHDEKYLHQVVQTIKKTKPTHYMHDPRSMSGGPFLKVYQSFLLASLLISQGIIPIVILTDISLRIPRLQGAVVTPFTGVAICFMSAKEAQKIFPHERMIAPSLMPFSIKTLKNLRQIRESKPDSNDCETIFIGALYEPRTSILEGIKCGLESNGYSFDVKGRLPGEKRVDDNEYWKKLAHADIIVTTTQQGFQHKTSSGRLIFSGADRVDVPQLIYRFLEATACGTLLVASEVPGVERYFTPWEHFIPFVTVEEAVERISYFNLNKAERQKIAYAGLKKAEALIKSRSFWLLIDSHLRKHSIF